MITLEYYEESEHTCDVTARVDMKSKYIYDENENDFEVEITGKRVYEIISGRRLSKLDPNIIEVKVSRTYDGLIIEYKNSSHVTTFRMVIGLNSIDWFRIKSGKIPTPNKITTI